MSTSEETLSKETLARAIEEYVIFEHKLYTSIEENTKKGNDLSDVNVIQLSREYAEWEEFKMKDSFRMKPKNLKRAQKFASKKLESNMDKNTDKTAAQVAAEAKAAEAKAKAKAVEEALAKANAENEILKEALKASEKEAAEAKAAKAKADEDYLTRKKAEAKESTEELKKAAKSLWETMKESVHDNRAKLAFISGAAGMYAAKAGFEMYQSKFGGESVDGM